MNFAGKVVFVTGAAQGMGRAIVSHFASVGASVVAADINANAAAEAVAALGERGLAMACNVSDPASVKAAFDAVGERFGRLDVVVNSAGIGSMRARGRGRIINVSSTAALSGEGPSHYCASKAGVMGLTRSIARELAASGIRVNTIVPGPTNTPMMAGIPDEWMQSMIKAIPLGRMCEPDEIARVAAFLASDDAGFITGQNIAVNGGMVFI